MSDQEKGRRILRLPLTLLADLFKALDGKQALLLWGLPDDFRILGISARDAGETILLKVESAQWEPAQRGQPLEWQEFGIDWRPLTKEEAAIEGWRDIGGPDEVPCSRCGESIGGTVICGECEPVPPPSDVPAHVCACCRQPLDVGPGYSLVSWQGSNVEMCPPCMEKTGAKELARAR